jgi:hypothetical protein
MRWFRSNARFGSWCALFALAAQLVLSFGHVHGDGQTAPSPSALLSAIWTLSAPTDAQSTPAVPDKPTGHLTDYCAICALIKLANGLMPVVAPVIQRPVRISSIEFDSDIAIALATSAHRFFQARAPPQA